MGNMTNKRVLVISLIFGIFTFLISVFYLNNVAKEQKYHNELIKVIVARVNIPARSVITKEMITIKAIPRQYVLSGATAKVEEMLGKVTTTAIIPGEQLTSSKFVARGSQLGLAFIIPQNKRAISVEVDASASLAGLIKPGDMVDVICTIASDKTERTITILQNVPIIAIDRQLDSQEKDNDKINRSVIATFALDVKNAEKLVLASSQGRLKLMLRPIDDKSTITSWGVTPYNLFPHGNSDGGYNIKIIKGTNISNKKL